MTKEYIRKLIERARKLQVRLDSPSQHLDKEMYISNIREEANGLVGYILALEEVETI